MVRLYQRYLDYRRVGFKRTAAFRFAWLVVMAGADPIPVRAARR
jgi:hypothetical protein